MSLDTAGILFEIYYQLRPTFSNYRLFSQFHLGLLMVAILGFLATGIVTLFTKLSSWLATRKLRRRWWSNLIEGEYAYYPTSIPIRKRVDAEFRHTLMKKGYKDLFVGTFHQVRTGDLATLLYTYRKALQGNAKTHKSLIPDLERELLNRCKCHDRRPDGSPETMH